MRSISMRDWASVSSSRKSAEKFQDENTLVPRTRADDDAKPLDVRASPSLKEREREQAARVEDHDE